MQRQAGKNMQLLYHFSIVPESFRWYISHDKTEEANRIIRSIAKYNNHAEVTVEKNLQKPMVTSNRKYTLLYMFKSRTLVKITILLMFNW